MADAPRYLLPSLDSPEAWDAQIATLATELRATVDEILTDGEPGTSAGAALLVALEELRREDSLAFRETLSRALDAVRNDLAAEYIRDVRGYELREFGARLPSAETRAAIVRDSISNAACDLGLEATDIIVGVRCAVEVELLAGAAIGMRGAA